MLSSLLALLRGEQPDRVVWTADITYWMAGARARGAADPAWETPDGFLALHRELGLLPYYEYGQFSAFRAEYDPAVTFTRETRGATTIERIATPAGELTAESVYLPDSCCQGITRHFVTSELDLDVLLDLLRRRRLVPANLDDYRARMARWAPHDGLPALGLPRSPLPALMVEWTGIEPAIYLLQDCEAKMREAMALMAAQEAPILDAVCDLAPPLVHFPDNLSSENLAGLYDDFLADGHRQRLARLHAAGVNAAVHLDGTVRGLLPKLAAAGFDAVEALTPQPCGDIDAAEMRRLVDGLPVILWGGVPGAMFAPPYAWDDMRRHLEGLLDAWRGHPFIVGVADQVPPDGDITFCRRIADLLAERHHT